MAKSISVDLFDILPNVNIDFERYYKSEVEVVNPQLREHGYKLIGSWFSGEADSFGPLSRNIDAKDPNGKAITIWYG